MRRRLPELEGRRVCDWWPRGGCAVRLGFCGTATGTAYPPAEPLPSAVLPALRTIASLRLSGLPRRASAAATCCPPAALRSLSNPREIAQNGDILRMFLMACSVKAVKLSVIGLSCLQKLISHDAVASSALKEILATLRDHSEMLDESLQLKTLQTMLIVFQSHLRPESEEDMSQALGICLHLLESNRSSDTVRNTAAATFRQGVALVFDNVVPAESLPAGKASPARLGSSASSVANNVTSSFGQTL